MNKTLKDLSYGLSTPKDLLGKLKFDAEQLKEDQHPYKIFNFIVTAGALAEWTIKYYHLKKNNPVLYQAFRSKKYEDRKLFPDEAYAWLKNTPNLPQPKERAKLHIQTCIQACYSIYTASKHVHWASSNAKITAIEDEPIVGNWYQYFFTGFDKGVYIEVDSAAYSLFEIAAVLNAFYGHLFPFLELQKNSDE
ncbi:MAG: hypothetical protein KKF12_13925 [Proteobacteria bacterium]|nr:hypothetical protein [Desulfobacula sp.]MBU3915242.1 hypothetical protein [bacterium]MBU4131914.1 hypothetical protein [Pseudomonadota bacterium]